MAYGEMGMSEREFDMSSPRYLMIRLVGMRKAQNEIITFQNKEEWNRARMVAFYAGFGQVKGLKIWEDVIKFPWDKTAELPTYEEMKKIFPKHLN
jgi:hypothetical protein